MNADFTAIRLRIFRLWRCGYNTKEIAHQIDMPESEVYKQLHVVKELIRQERAQSGFSGT